MNNTASASLSNVKTLVIFLAATGLTLTGCMPKHDLFINVLNVTSQQIEECNSIMTYCQTIRPGGTAGDSQATEGRVEEGYAAWIDQTVLKVCGKLIPFKDAFEVKGVDREFWSKKVTYNLAVRNDVVTQACSGGSKPEASDASR